MSVLSKEDFFKRVESLVGSDPTDDALSLLEDIEDTFNSFQGNGDNEDWKTKYDELDAQWRDRYKKRFFSGKSEDDKEFEDNNNDEVDDEPQNYDDLFKERED